MNREKSFRLVIMAGALTLGAPAMAQAQERTLDPLVASCGCVQPLPAGTRLGSVNSVAGDVLVTGRTGLVPAQPGSPLSLGSRLLTGPTGTAVLSLAGNCQLSVPADAQVDVAAVEGRLCVRIATVEGGQVPGLTTFEVVAGGLIAGAAAAAIIFEDDDRVSPVSR